MPAIAAFDADDAASTPVSHTYDPVGIMNGVATYENRAGGISVGFEKATLTHSLPSKTSRLHKVRFKLVLPVLETTSNSTYSGIAPAPTKAYDLTADVTFFMPERATLQQRKDLWKLFHECLDANQVRSCIEDLESVY